MTRHSRVRTPKQVDAAEARWAKLSKRLLLDQLHNQDDKIVKLQEHLDEYVAHQQRLKDRILELTKQNRILLADRARVDVLLSQGQSPSLQVCLERARYILDAKEE